MLNSKTVFTTPIKQTQINITQVQSKAYSIPIPHSQNKYLATTSQQATSVGTVNIKQVCMNMSRLTLTYAKPYGLHMRGVQSSPGLFCKAREHCKGTEEVNNTSKEEEKLTPVEKKPNTNAIVICK